MKTDMLSRYVTDILLALVLLTRLPLPRLPREAFSFGARAVWAYPLAGAVLGSLAMICGYVAIAAGLPPAAAAGVALGAMIVLSGAMHEDGLADVTDGFWGGHDADARLAIMRDSQIGSYGTLALVLVTGLRWTFVAVLLPVAPAASIVAASVSRAAMPPVMYALPHARKDGLARSVGTPPLASVVLGAIIAMAVGVAAVGIIALAAACAAGISAGAACIIARRKIGGQTGDVLGATQQLSEIAVLCVLVIGLT